MTEATEPPKGRLNLCETPTMEETATSISLAVDTKKIPVNELENSQSTDLQQEPFKDTCVDIINAPLPTTKDDKTPVASDVTTTPESTQYEIINSTTTTEGSSQNMLIIPNTQGMNIEVSDVVNEKTDDNVISKSADAQNILNENMYNTISAQDVEEAYTSCMDEITALCNSNEVIITKKGRNLTSDTASKKPDSNREPGCSGRSGKTTTASFQLPAASSNQSVSDLETLGRKKVNIFTQNTGPQWYDTNDNMRNISKNIIPTKLPEAFEFLPIFGRPKTKAELDEFQENKIREFVGSGLNDEEYASLDEYCSPDRLKTGKELVMSAPHPGFGMMDETAQYNAEEDEKEKEYELCVVKKHKLRTERDSGNFFAKKLKYRGVRLMPMTQEKDTFGPESESLQPGKDLIFRIRIYRPFVYNKFKYYRGRHSIFSHDVVMTGRQTVADLRDQFICSNDIDMRVDVSERIDEPMVASAKDLFPSGFLFVNNVFYVDHRTGCSDTSQVIRDWAAKKRGLGEFPHRDMSSVRLDELVLRLGHPEVYVHQGECEHLFTFSEIRLVNLNDPLKPSLYPCHTAISQNQTVYCTTCAEFGAKWIVTGCNRVPFDPAFFCETCIKLYLYEDGKKTCDFKAYCFRGNEINVLKPQG